MNSIKTTSIVVALLGTGIFIRVDSTAAAIVDFTYANPRVVTNNESGNQFFGDNNGSLTINSGGVAGDVSLSRGSSLDMKGDSNINGILDVRDSSRIYTGTDNSGTAKIRGAAVNGSVVIIGRDSQANLDRAFIQATSDGISHLGENGGAVIVQDGGNLIVSGQTTIDGAALDMGLFVEQSRSLATIKGTHVLGGITGVSSMDAHVDATGAWLRGGNVGAEAIYGGSLALHGTTVIGGGGGLATENSAGIRLLVAPDAGNLPTPVTEVTIDNNSSVTGNGLAAGIRAEMAGVEGKISINNSAVKSGGRGIEIVDGTYARGGIVTVLIDQSTIAAGREGILVSGKNVSADVKISNASSLSASSGVLVRTDADSTTTLNVSDSALNGDVINSGITSIHLADKHASWTGRMQNVTNVSTVQGAYLDLTGNVSISHLTNNGTTGFSSGASGHSLTVNDYVGNGGNLVLNTVLGDDHSVTDKLVVTGNTSGTTSVYIQNAGGTGAKTVDGIEVINVAGQSDGNFKQAKRITAGAYDYTLTRGKGAYSKNWYLESDIGSQPPIHDDDKPVKPLPVHVTRPEAGSYIANQAASTMFLTSLHDRAGGNRYMNVGGGNTTSLWLRQVGIYNQFHDSTGQLKTIGNTYVAQLGGDLTQLSSTDRDSFHLGLMVGYGNNHNNTLSSFSGHSSKGNVTGYSVGTYGTWYQNDTSQTGAYVDSQLIYSWFDNHVDGEALRSESYKSKGLTASIETGYTLALGQSRPTDNFIQYYLEPQIQATWMGVRADGLTEENGTRVSSQGNNNVQTRVGIRAFLRGHSHIDNGKDRSFQPFIEVSWLHNTKRNGVIMNDVSLEQAGVVNAGEVKLGVEGQVAKRVQLWGNVGQQMGGEGYSNTTAMLGLKYLF